MIIICSGESMENALRACCKGIKIGKILIHRDGDNGKQVFFFFFNLLVAECWWVFTHSCIYDVVDYMHDISFV